MQLLNDIKNFKNLSKQEKIYLISFLSALSGVLSVIDYMIPKPLPFIKIGLAHIIILIIILEKQYLLSIYVTIIRTIVSSLMIGSFLSYTFLLSFTGAFSSTIAMIISYILFQNYLSAIGVSIIGGFINILSQCTIVILIFGLEKGLIILISILLLISLVNSIITGILAIRIHSNENYNQMQNNTN